MSFYDDLAEEFELQRNGMTVGEALIDPFPNENPYLVPNTVFPFPLRVRMALANHPMRIPYDETEE